MTHTFESSTTMVIALPYFSTLPPPLLLSSPSTNLNTITRTPHLLSNPLHRTTNRRRYCSSVPLASSSLAIPINVDYYEKVFSGHGVSFESIGDTCVISMATENGSKAKLMLPSGLITSYRPHLWHGGDVEVLHTSVFKAKTGDIVVRGGVSVAAECVGEEGAWRWSPSTWALHDIRSSSQEGIQVELRSIAAEEMVELKCLVSLNEDHLGSELTVTNQSSSSSSSPPLQVSASVMSHLTVSSPDATYAVGLQGSSYFCKQPLKSKFTIIPPDFLKNDQKPLTVFQSWEAHRRRSQDLDSIDETEREEDDDCAQMTEKMSRIYTTAPRHFTLIDRGRRNSVNIQRTGFNELYVFSPGSSHESYGRYAYVCVGTIATLKPIVLAPGCAWRGAHYLCNPNL